MLNYSQDVKMNNFCWHFDYSLWALEDIGWGGGKKEETEYWCSLAALKLLSFSFVFSI